MASSGSILLANKAFFTFILMVCYQALILLWQHFERISVLGPSQDTQLNWWPIFQQDTASSPENNRAPSQVSKCFWLERVDTVFRQSRPDSVKQAHVRKQQQPALPLRDSCPASKKETGTGSLELNQEGSKTPCEDLLSPGVGPWVRFLGHLDDHHRL